MYKKLLLIANGLILSFSFTFAQINSNRCVTWTFWNQKVLKDPDCQNRMNNTERQTQNWVSMNSGKFQKNSSNKTNAVVTIPVVVHVIWHSSVENISTAQIESQIVALNEDFRLLNADSLPTSHPFWGYTSDSEIEFCLASSDPDGLPTNGITRTYTDSVYFAEGTNAKFFATGGHDNWDPYSYLNIWVCNFGPSGLLGFATFPSDLSSDPELDGVVIRYEAFGTIGTAGTGAFSANDYGRTGTHEVGHWLNLRHIWGDDFCGDDFVSDTETAEEANYGCPSFPYNAFNSCGTGANGEMYMNYMDYVDDRCMNMFTYGQALRMHATLNGDRVDLLYSTGCSPSTKIVNDLASYQIALHPNPSAGIFTLSFTDLNITTEASVQVFNSVGQEVMLFTNVTAFPMKIDSESLPSGIYKVKVSSNNSSVCVPLIINR